MNASLAVCRALNQTSVSHAMRSGLGRGGWMEEVNRQFFKKTMWSVCLKE